MAKKPARVAVIGLDCALPHLMEKHMQEGILPNMKRLFESGAVMENCLTNYPTVTPPGWATIATGALAGTHGITDFFVHQPGTELSNANTVAAFSSQRVKAEYIWDALDRIGKKCIVLNYPGSWPSKMEHGIMVGGAGLTPAEFRDGHMGLNFHARFCSNGLITTGVFPYASRGEFGEASGWAGAPEMAEALEMSVEYQFNAPMAAPEKTVFHVWVQDTQGQGYDTATLALEKDLGQALCTLRQGQWSPNIFAAMREADGTVHEVVFRCYLARLSADAEDFRLVLTPMVELSGWTSPEELAKELVFDQGSIIHAGGYAGYSMGWYDEEVYAEMSREHDRWLGSAAVKLMEENEWDLFYMHSHPPDWVYHAVITKMDEKLNDDSELREKAWQLHRQVYMSQDAMLGRIMEAAGKDTLFILVSDHGAVPDGPMVDPFKPLVAAGLTRLKEQDYDTGGTKGKMDAMFKSIFQVADVQHSKAIPQRSLYVYVNLKGRDPGGIVEPEDYEKVQRQIIDALLTYRDPETGQRPVSLALSRRDARILGLYGEHVGDVVYAVQPEFGSQHGQQLPACEWGVGSLKGLFTMTGPGVKKGHRLERTVWLTDLVPTLCYLMDWPVPETAEGAVIYQAFKDPNFKTKELNKLQEGLKRMETALKRSEREPWDKHDCA